MIETCLIDLDSQLTHYVIIRDDLPFGVLAAQVTHAAGESSQGNLPKNTIAVVLGVKKHELLDISDALNRNDIAHCLITEIDPPYLGEPMAIGITPRPKKDVYHLLRQYNLLGYEGEK